MPRRAANAQQAIGDRLPELSLPLVSGGTLSLEQRLREHRGALVVFWSSLCAHCLRYDAFLNTFEDRHPSVALMVVAARHGEAAGEIQRHMAERRLQFPVAHSNDGAAAAAWLVPQTPRVYLVDAQRTLLYRGAIDNYKYGDDPAHIPYLESAVDAFLAGRPISRADTPSFGCAVNSVYYVIGKRV